MALITNHYPCNYKIYKSAIFVRLLGIFIGNTDLRNYFSILVYSSEIYKQFIARLNLIFTLNRFLIAAILGCI